ncbi:MAG: pseudouridine synthase, partial [Candidatus Margulisiibacteriota bacterium]
MKLQHYLSKNQIFSRRVADRMVSEGYVTVDGHLITDSLFNIEDENQVGFKSKINDYIESLGFVLFNKPRGVWTNCKQGFNEKEVIDLLPKRFQNYASIGRLDKDSEGLILFTNDGVFANRFLNSNEIHSREYLVTTKRPLSLKQMHRLEAGVILK